MAIENTGRLVKVKSVPANGAFEVEELVPGGSVADVDDASLPANGTISGLTISDPPTQAEVQALRDECENLRDALANSISTINTLRDRLEVTGGAAVIADA